MEDLKKIQEFFSKPLEENIVVRMYNTTDKTADLYKEDNPGLEFYLTGKEGQDYVRKYKDHISFPFSSHMNDGTPIPNYEENKEKLAAYLKQKGIPFKTTSTKPLRGVSRTTGEDYMATTDTFKVPLSHVDIKKIQEFFSKPLEENVDKKYSDFLVALRDSGITNMFGAAPYLQAEFGLDKREAREILANWMRSFGESLNENTFKKGDKVTYLGNPAEITFVGKDQMDRTYYNVAYDKGNGRTKASNLYNKGGEIKSIKEMDMNDPVMMKMRAAKDKLAKMRAANAGDDGNDKFFDNAKKIAFLKKEREQLMRDMEQEAEPEGGPIADEYGSKLNRIDAAIAKLSGRKEMTYDQAISESASTEEKRIALRAIKSIAKYRGVSEDEAKRDLTRAIEQLGSLKEAIKDIKETIELGKNLNEELCAKGKAYRKKRMAAGEKSSAYLNGRAVKVCKGQMKG